MTNTGTAKSKTVDNEKQQERQNEHHEAERSRQQDLNQRMDTGTHDSQRHSVNWGSSTAGGRADQADSSQGRKQRKKTDEHNETSKTPTGTVGLKHSRYSTDRE